MLPKANSRFCLRHLSLSRLTTDELAAELLGPTPDFSSAHGVNLFLGNLVTQFAHRRIERRDAVTLAYLGQLLLNSLAALDRRNNLDAQLDSEQPPAIIFDLPRPDRSSQVGRQPGMPGQSPNAASDPSGSQQSWRSPT